MPVNHLKISVEIGVFGHFNQCCFIGDNSLFANDITLVVGDHQCGQRQCDNHSHYAEQATPD